MIWWDVYREYGRFGLRRGRGLGLGVGLPWSIGGLVRVRKWELVVCEYKVSSSSRGGLTMGHVRERLILKLELHFYIYGFVYFLS